MVWQQGSKLKKVIEAMSLERASMWKRALLEGIKGDSAPKRIFRLLDSRPSLKLWVLPFLYLRMARLVAHSFINSVKIHCAVIVCEALQNPQGGRRHKRKHTLFGPRRVETQV